MKTNFFAVLLLTFSFLFAFSSLAEEKAGFWESIGNFFLPHAEKRNVLFEKQTQYFLVTVEEDHNGFRHMVFNPNKGSQGIWNPKMPDELISNYCRFTTIFLPAMKNPPKRVLFIGLGAGVVPRFVRKNFPDTVIDIVEIDGDIPVIAENYFGFKKDDKINITIGDGRNFINRNKEKYDVIFIDAYTSECIPFQLTTEEFYLKVRDSLAPDGIMTANVANLGKPTFIASEIKTARAVFPPLAVFITGNRSNYILFSAADRKLNTAELKENASRIEAEKNLSLKIGDMIDTRMPEDDIKKMIEGVEILKDDFAPVETMK
ncbi:MAG TPA: hypothetical protein DET40_14690 [Lentisphaeria bacterium]|nr:MAG: hypothetical protein A2X45_05860 [Lentisphaerae bacterium GWF2_50_93]HCE44785.1 hypothetical protein [Lentisphaeria bacterium]